MPTVIYGLHDEVILGVMRQLTFYELISTTHVSRRFRRVGLNPSLWRSIQSNGAHLWLPEIVNRSAPYSARLNITGVRLSGAKVVGAAIANGLSRFEHLHVELEVVRNDWSGLPKPIVSKCEPIWTALSSAQAPLLRVFNLSILYMPSEDEVVTWYREHNRPMPFLDTPGMPFGEATLGGTSRARFVSLPNIRSLVVPCSAFQDVFSLVMGRIGDLRFDFDRNAFAASFPSLRNLDCVVRNETELLALKLPRLRKMIVRSINPPSALVPTICMDWAVQNRLRLKIDPLHTDESSDNFELKFLSSDVSTTSISLVVHRTELNLALSVPLAMLIADLPLDVHGSVLKHGEFLFGFITKTQLTVTKFTRRNLLSLSTIPLDCIRHLIIDADETEKVTITSTELVSFVFILTLGSTPVRELTTNNLTVDCVAGIDLNLIAEKLPGIKITVN